MLWYSGPQYNFEFPLFKLIAGESPCSIYTSVTYYLVRLLQKHQYTVENRITEHAEDNFVQFYAKSV